MTKAHTARLPLRRDTEVFPRNLLSQSFFLLCLSLCLLLARGVLRSSFLACPPSYLVHVLLRDMWGTRAQVTIYLHSFYFPSFAHACVTTFCLFSYPNHHRHSFKILVCQAFGCSPGTIHAWNLPCTSRIWSEDAVSDSPMPWLCSDWGYRHGLGNTFVILGQRGQVRGPRYPMEPMEEGAQQWWWQCCNNAQGTSQAELLRGRRARLCSHNSDMTLKSSIFKCASTTMSYWESLTLLLLSLVWDGMWILLHMWALDLRQLQHPKSIGDAHCAVGTSKLLC